MILFEVWVNVQIMIDKILHWKVNLLWRGRMRAVFVMVKSKVLLVKMLMEYLLEFFLQCGFYILLKSFPEVLLLLTISSCGLYPFSYWFYISKIILVYGCESVTDPWASYFLLNVVIWINLLLKRCVIYMVLLYRVVNDLLLIRLCIFYHISYIL